MRVYRVTIELAQLLSKHVDGADRFDSIGRTGWRDLRLRMPFQPPTISSIALILLPTIFLPLDRMIVASPIACMVGATRAKLPQRRVRVAASCVSTVRGQNQAVNRRIGTPFTLHFRLIPQSVVTAIVPTRFTRF